MLGAVDEPPRLFGAASAVQNVWWLDEAHLLVITGPDAALVLHTLDGEKRVLARPRWNRSASMSVR